MVEPNTFRNLMLISVVIVIAIVFFIFFTYPMINVDDNAIANYENVMGIDLGETNQLTGYQAVMFAIKGIPRGGVSHY